MNQLDVHLELKNKNLHGKSEEGWKLLRKIGSSSRSMHLALPITDSFAKDISMKLDAVTSKKLPSPNTEKEEKSKLNKASSSVKKKWK